MGSEFMHQAFQGMKDMDQSNAQALSDGAIADYCKFTELLKALEQDVDNQIKKSTFALKKTWSKANELQQELEYMEHEFVESEEQMTTVKAAFEQAKQSMQQQDEHVNKLMALKARVSSKQNINYWGIISDIVPNGDLAPNGQIPFEYEKDSMRQWVESIFYNPRRTPLQKPAALQSLTMGPDESPEGILKEFCPKPPLAIELGGATPDQTFENPGSDLVVLSPASVSDASTSDGVMGNAEARESPPNWVQFGETWNVED